MPKHEILDKDEVEQILEEYQVTKNELPRIQKDDPAIKELGPQVGDVIKITRDSPSAGTSFYYRVVIEG